MSYPTRSLSQSSNEPVRPSTEDDRYLNLEIQPPTNNTVYRSVDFDDAPTMRGFTPIDALQQQQQHVARDVKPGLQQPNWRKSENWPPNPPCGYIEPYTHFTVSNKPAEEVFDVVKDALRQMGAYHRNQHRRQSHVDVESVNDRKFKIKCTAYSAAGGSALVFVVRLFSLENGPELAVEFNRRQGDTVFFFSIYRQCLKEMKSKGLLPADYPIGEEHSLHIPTLVSDTTAESVDADVDSLTEGIQSQYCDVRQQSAEAMAETAPSVPHATSMSRDSVLRAIYALLDVAQDGDDVPRCGVTILAHVSEQNPRSCQSIFGSSAMPQILALLSKTQNRQIQRESTRLLANLHHTLGAPVKQLVRTHCNDITLDDELARDTLWTLCE